ncbi:MAG: hypothetical protein KAT65_20800 [Methanophagales archaeon]|nr:hypothetical protein [Methanophagales archaeon]
MDELVEMKLKYLKKTIDGIEKEGGNYVLVNVSKCMQILRKNKIEMK